MKRIIEQPSLSPKLIEGYQKGKSEILNRYVSFSEACSMYLSEQLTEEV